MAVQHTIFNLSFFPLERQIIHPLLVGVVRNVGESSSQGTFWTESKIQYPLSSLALISPPCVPLALIQVYNLYAKSPPVDVVFVLTIVIAIVAFAKASTRIPPLVLNVTDAIF